MRTIKVVKLFILTLAVGLIATAVTYGAGPAAVTAKNIRQKIVDVVYTNPDQEDIPTEGIVTLLFMVSDEGKIDIKKMESTNTEAENFVIKKVSGLSCKDNVYPYHQYYRVKFHFEKN